MNVVEKTKQAIKQELKRALSESGFVKTEEIPNIVLEIPKEKAHGDYATNVAMQLAKKVKKPPRAIAEEVVARFRKKEVSVAKVEIAGPGFINFFMDPEYLSPLSAEIIKAGERYGATQIGEKKKVQVEFVSANPTGSLHLGHARGAAYGDALSNILEKAGYDVAREYYINDAGNQIHQLALSLEARYFQELGYDKKMPEDGYYGEDMIEFARELVQKYGDAYVHKDSRERYDFFREYGLKREIAKLRQDLQDYRVEFDEWFSETSLYESGEVQKVIQMLRDGGHLYEKDGATWFRSTVFGDDKDRVLIKSDGSYTYLTPDIAYHLNKFKRGFQTLINIWGGDHHGYIARVRAAIEALGYSPEQLKVQIIQMVNLIKDGERVKMSKRTGKAVTLRELMEEVGIDAMRYFFAARSSDTQLDFDMDLAVSRSNENPVYYVQYAHARVCSILRQGEEMGLAQEALKENERPESEKEIELLKILGEFPGAVQEAAEKLAVQRVTNYVFDLASALHRFYNAERVLDAGDREKSIRRYQLMKAVQITLKNGLDLIGVRAPEQM